MTVQQLHEILDEHCPNPDDEVPLSLIIGGLSYVVAALEQYSSIGR